MKALIPLALGLSLLAGCSADDEPQKEAASTSPSSDTEAGNEPRECKATVELTGAIEKSWKGKARAILDNSSGPPVFYQAAKGDTRLSVYAKGGDFVASAVINSSKGNYSTKPDADGLDVQDDGSGASVDVDAAGAGADKKAGTTHITADITC